MVIQAVFDFLKFRGKIAIVAPYESDAQLARLFNDKLVDFVLSEDSDMFAYGCFKIVSQLKCNGDCLILNLMDFPSQSDKIRTLLEFGEHIRSCHKAESVCDEWMRLSRQFKGSWHSEINKVVRGKTSYKRQFA